MYTLKRKKDYLVQQIFKGFSFTQYLFKDRNAIGP